MQIQTTLLASLGFILISAPYAQIRQYDPTTGQSVEIPAQGTITPGVQQNAIKTPITQPKKPSVAPNQVAPSPASIANGTVGQIPALGQALVFISVEKFTGGVAAMLKEAQTLQGLAIQTYVNELEPAEYLKLAAKAEKEISGLSFRVDSGGAQAFRHNVKDDHTILYIDPTGTRRFYDALGEGDKFLRHVKRIQKKLKARK